jgi:hypothetical protein
MSMRTEWVPARILIKSPSNTMRRCKGSASIHPFTAPAPVVIRPSYGTTPGKHTENPYMAGRLKGLAQNCLTKAPVCASGAGASARVAYYYTSNGRWFTKGNSHSLLNCAQEFMPCLLCISSPLLCQSEIIEEMSCGPAPPLHGSPALKNQTSIAKEIRKWTRPNACCWQYGVGWDLHPPSL